MSSVPQFLNMLIIVVFVTDVERGVNGAAVWILAVSNGRHKSLNEILCYRMGLNLPFGNEKFVEI